MSVSILILTLNEERNIDACLKSVSWSDDVVVLDSYSTDDTLNIAKNHSARIYQRQFDNWSSHQNWAIQNIDFKYDWVYYSDADEIITDDLREELIKVSKQPQPGNVAYRLRYRNYFMGRWIRHASMYPVWVLRFFRPDCIQWQRSVNPVPIVNGHVGKLKSHFQHYSFNKGFDAWMQKHNNYSSQEAVESIESLKRDTPVLKAVLTAREPARRRIALKELSFRLPFRPFLRFIYMYVWRRGFMDGFPGLTYCRLLAIYEYMIVLKIAEIKRREKGLPI